MSDEYSDVLSMFIENNYLDEYGLKIDVTEIKYENIKDIVIGG